MKASKDPILTEEADGSTHTTWSASTFVVMLWLFIYSCWVYWV